MKLSADLVAFITGGASGLGEATVRLLRSKGCKVAIADLNEERMSMLKKELGTDGGLITFKCDVTSEEQVEKAIKETARVFGSIHVALPSAGVVWGGYTLNNKGKPLDMNIIKKVMDINLFGSLYVAKYASVIMSQNKPNEKGERGVIIFVSSIAA